MLLVSVLETYINMEDAFYINLCLITEQLFTLVPNALLSWTRSCSLPVMSHGTKNSSLDIARVAMHSRYFRDPI